MNEGGLKELIAHPEWERSLKEHLNERLSQYRVRNDAEQTHDAVLRNQGAISEIKYWLALDRTILSLIHSAKTEGKQTKNER